VHDAVSVERLGIPAAVVVTDRFRSTARVMAAFLGVADYPCVVIPHPLSNDDDAAIRAKAELAVRQAVALWVPTRPSAGAPGDPAWDPRRRAGPGR
jgi:hypothetical protein